MKTKRTLLVLLLLIAFAMIVIGIISKIAPPILTGIGFIIISILFHQNSKK